jgi:hypothetical protein
MSTRAAKVDTVIRRQAGQVAVHVAPPDGIDLQFIYRAALSIYWNPFEALLEDRCSAVESSEASAVRIARALREEYGMVLQPSDNVQWKGFSAEERSQVASALFGQVR